VVTQHIPAVFSRAFADRLNQICPVKVVEASDGMPLQAGLALVAPGDYHLEIEKSACGWRARVRTGEKVWYQRPSVDVLFRSVARAAGSSSVGVLLTGMGGDGADGMLDMRRTGALTIAQDEATSVVWGMPRAAVENGAAAKVAPLGEIPGLLLRRARS
jgi:two-component system chemotaxis response regulator CheB